LELSCPLAGKLGTEKRTQLEGDTLEIEIKKTITKKMRWTIFQLYIEKTHG